MGERVGDGRAEADRAEADRAEADRAEATMRGLEQLAKAHGLDERRVVEEALLLHLRELRARCAESTFMGAPPGSGARGGR